MISDTLKSYIPPFLSSTQTFSEIFDADGQEFDAIYSDINDIKSQLIIDTATWGLDIYEKDFGITTDYTKSLDYRRSVIKAKGRGSGKLTATLIEVVCDSFSNGDVQVTFDGIIHIKFTSIKGIPPNMDDLESAIEQMKPAYLAVVYAFTYNTNDMLSAYTNDQLHAYTNDQLQTI